MSIHRTFGVCYQTVMKWLGEKRRLCPRSRTRCCPARTVTCWGWMNSGALWEPRRTASGSKCTENQLDAIHLSITNYNLGIKQATPN